MRVFIYFFFLSNVSSGWMIYNEHKLISRLQMGIGSIPEVVRDLVRGQF